MARFEAQVMDRAAGGFDHHLEATLLRALLIRVNPGDIRSGQAMTNSKLMISDTGAETFDRFAILRETPSRQSKPTGYSAPVQWLVYPADIALMKTFVLRGSLPGLVRKDSSQSVAHPVSPTPGRLGFLLPT